MSTRIFIFLFSIIISFNSTAQQTDSEPLTQVIEMDRLIINWSPNDTSLGRVMAYRCEGCPATIMTIDRNAQLEINGKPHPISELSLKVDWAGAVMVTDQAPTHILKFLFF